MKAAAWMVCVLGGCAVGSVDLPDPTPAQSGGDNEPFSTGEDCQGRHMLGLAPDLLAPQGSAFVSFVAESSNRPGVTVSVVGGILVAKSKGVTQYSGKDPAFIGMQLRSADGNGEVEIRGVVPQSYGTSYTLQIKGTTIDYCGGAGAAAPLQGVIEADRFHVGGTNVTFACDDGVAKKCQGWGYVAGNDPNSSGWRHHQACMRMANADVYGNGETHTRELTPIDIRDMMTGAQPAPMDFPALGYPQMTPPPPDVSFFEAAWGWERNRGAICLAKPRWASLPVEAPHHDSLPDPRNVDGDDVAFCEDLSIDQMMARGALLFNGSKRMDMYLNRWRNPTTGNLIASVRGMSSLQPGRRQPPFPGYTEYLGTDGILLRNLTGTLESHEVTKMYVQHNPKTGDYVVATKTPVSADHVIKNLDDDFEGYTLNNPGPDLTPLGLFVQGTDYVTSVGGPGTIGYQGQGTLHYVMEPNWAGPTGSGQGAGFSPRVTASACQSPQ